MRTPAAEYLTKYTKYDTLHQIVLFAIEFHAT
jgi:hypothetical protein